MLFIGPDEKQALAAAVARARAKPIPIADVMRGAKGIDQSTDAVTLAERKMAPIPRKPEQVELPVGYRVAIACEEQPAGICLHLSMSTSASGKVPSPQALLMLLQAMDLEGQPVRTWIEEFEIEGKPSGHAVNVVVLLGAAQGGHA
jgi:hypothetical protein